MDYFIDTNVAVAFTFFPDKFHDSVKDLILEKYSKIYWSNNVLKEYGEKYDEIYPNFEDFLDSILFNLRNSNVVFLNKYSFEHFILQKTKDIDLDSNKKLKILDYFWDEILLGIFKEQSEFIAYFEDYAIYVPRFFESNDEFLRNNLNFYDCGLENYKKYFKYFYSLKRMGVHDSDAKIALDAHDFANGRFTVFVTTDRKFYNKVKDLYVLNIDEYKLLN